MSKNFNDLLAQVSKCEMKRLSVAVTQDKPVLEAVKEAADKGIATAILVGDKAQIESIAAEIGMDLTKHEIIDECDIEKAAETALRFDSTPDYSLKSLRFAECPEQVLIYDILGASACGSVSALLDLLGDDALTAQWKELTGNE